MNPWSPPVSSSPAVRSEPLILTRPHLSNRGKIVEYPTKCSAAPRTQRETQNEERTNSEFQNAKRAARTSNSRFSYSVFLIVAVGNSLHIALTGEYSRGGGACQWWGARTGGGTSVGPALPFF